MTLGLRAVAVTGLGLVSPLGPSLNEAWRAVQRGEIPAEAALHSNSRYGDCRAEALEIAGFDPRPSFSAPKAIKLTDRRTRLAVAAAAEALRDAGLTVPLEDEAFSERAGVVIGTSGSDLMADDLAIALQGGSESGDVSHLPRFASRILGGLTPLWLLVNLPNMVSAHVAIQFGMRGPDSTVMTDWTAGLQAIAEGASWIASGEADLVVAGGAETGALPFVIGAYEASGLFEPFSEREGPFRFGEGAAIVVLEEKERALRRKAPIRALIEGSGQAASLNEDAGALAMEVAILQALETAGSGTAEVGGIGWASVLSERPYRVESDAIHRCFGAAASEILLPAASPLGGFALGASGAIDFAFLVKWLQEPGRMTRGLGLCTSVGFSGQAVCVSARRPEETA